MTVVDRTAVTRLYRLADAFLHPHAMGPWSRCCCARLTALLSHRAGEAQGERQRLVQQSLFRRRERANEVGKRALEKTHEFIAVNAAIVFQTFVDANIDLGMQAISAGIYRRTDYRGERTNQSAADG